MKLLTDYLINAAQPNGEERRYWGAGSQLSALRFYLHEDVKILVSSQDHDYQGNVYALLQFPGGVYALWRDSFGSCSGCDSLEGENGHDYIKATLAEGNTRQFACPLDAGAYLEETSDYAWSRGGLEEFKAELLKIIGA